MRLVCLLILSLAACGDDSSPMDAGPDSAVDGGGGTDSGLDADRPDADRSDTGVDAGLNDGGSEDTGAVDAPTDAGGDAGPICEADSCAAAVCGRSDCGYPCGVCPDGRFCALDGGCAEGAPPGELCIDTWGEGVVEGASGYRTCDDDPAMVQRCMCSGGGPDAWFGCGDCESLAVAAPRGSRCADDAHCAGALPCHPSIRLCGERCDRGIPDPCPEDTRCGIPGDVAGVCLTQCLVCGGVDACDPGFECVPAEGGTACVPNGYGWVDCPG